jgi:pyridinium-3,5-biscarboxylic acid mononucleotide sulfurtransferase
MPDPFQRIEAVLDAIGPLVIACSGGIDSMLLAVIAHRRAPGQVVVAHAISPAVPEEGTARVKNWAAREGWSLHTVRSGEFEDESYLSNPVNRCYFCKSNLYLSLQTISAELSDEGIIVSGANLDDLGEYRPGLIAASERDVRHPWIEAEISKADIRALAHEFALPFADLAASPCLASRLYTGTRVTPERLRAIYDCEALIRERTGIAVVRCRIRAERMIVEVGNADRHRITAALLGDVLALAIMHEPALKQALLDDAAYQAGRAFVGAR